MTTFLLEQIRSYAKDRDNGIRYAAERLRGAIERLKKQHRTQPWCCFKPPPSVGMRVADVPK